MKITLFILIYLLLCNWFRIKSLLSAFLHPKKKIRRIKDQWIIDTIKKKTGLTIKNITIFETDKLFGMMAGIPTKPIMILSRGIYKEFKKWELEWVILHEAAHYILWHSAKMASFQLGSVLLGIFLLNYFQSAFYSIILATILAFFFIRYSKQYEHEADKYAIEKVDNPKGVITAQEKLIKHYKINENSFFRKYFTSGTLPTERIALAKSRM